MKSRRASSTVRRDTSSDSTTAFGWRNVIHDFQNPSAIPTVRYG